MDDQPTKISECKKPEMIGWEYEGRRPKRPKEDWVKKQIKNQLKQLGIWYFMPQSTNFGRNGIPDFICCLMGMFIGIEAKSSCTGHSWSIAQQDIATEINDVDGYYFLVDEDGLYSLFRELSMMATRGDAPMLLDLRGKDND